MYLKLVVLCVVRSIFFFGQPTGVLHSEKYNSESYFNLKDSLLTRELICFLEVAKQQRRDSCANIVYSVKPFKVTENSITFVEKNISSLKLLVEITLGDVDTVAEKVTRSNINGGKLWLHNQKICFGVNDDQPTRKLRGIRILVFNGRVPVPDSLLHNIYSPNLFCEDTNTLACSVFRSFDRKRIYIHMLNGSQHSLYEVTWILTKGKFQRVIDTLD